MSDNNKIEFLKNLQVLKVEKNDMIVIQFDEYISQEMVARVKDYVKALYPDNKIMITGKNINVGIIRKGFHE